MQENHSFDNYFGTYPGADGIPADTCMPVGHARRPCVRPFHLGGRSSPDLAHDRRIHRSSTPAAGWTASSGRPRSTRQSAERSVMGYYDGRDLPFYWNVADEYVLFDRFFAASPGGSVANHLFWVSGIFGRLQERGISWKFYVQDYDPRLGRGQARRRSGSPTARSVGCRGTSSTSTSTTRISSAGAFPRSPTSRRPAPASIRRGRIAAGATLVRALLTALARSSAWDSSAFMWTYDEWGGWFDHVRPPPGGAGFRVPALLVSPYARRGYVDSTPARHHLDPRPSSSATGRLAARAPRARSFERRVRLLARAPRARASPAAQRRPAARRGARIWVIYVGYGAALAPERRS